MNTEDTSGGEAESYSESDAEAALMAAMGAGADEGAGGEDEGQNDDGDEGHEDAPAGDDEGQDDADGADDDDNGQEDADTSAPAPLDDAHEIEIPNEGGEPIKVRLGDLKALHGRDAELTRKDREIEAVGGQAAATLQAAMDMVEEDLGAYANVDWLVLQQQEDPETFRWHRENASRLAERYRTLTGASEQFQKAFAARKGRINAEAKAAADRELAADVPGWNDAMHSEVLAYGASQGLDADELKTVTNAKVLKLIRKAMMHDKAATVAAQKVKEAPAKTVKTGNRQSPSTTGAINAKKAMSRLKTSGSAEDAMAVLMGRMG